LATGGASSRALAVSASTSQRLAGLGPLMLFNPWQHPLMPVARRSRVAKVWNAMVQLPKGRRPGAAPVVGEYAAPIPAVAFDTPRALLRNQSLSAIEPVCGTPKRKLEMAIRDLRPQTADPGHETGNIGARDSRPSAKPREGRRFSHTWKPRRSARVLHRNRFQCLGHQQRHRCRNADGRPDSWPIEPLGKPLRTRPAEPQTGSLERSVSCSWR
jgi:hypothetical protein